MAALQEATKCHGFQAKWELDEQMASTNIASEIQMIEGMPDVKWNLQWNFSPTDTMSQLYLNIESKNEIQYTVFLYYFRHPGNIKYRLHGTSTGRKELLLESLPFDFQHNAINGKLAICVDGNFSYTKKPDLKEFTQFSAEWGLRLKDSFPKDFDIVVGENVIQVQKGFLAVESTVFTKMFESNFKEAAEKKVTITDANYETVQAAIDYCYRQDISDFLQDLTNSINLLFFCDKYDFQTLKPMLEEHLSTKFLSKENLLLLATTSFETNALQLRQECISYMCDLLKKNLSFPAEELAQFDAKFKDDVLLQAFK